LLILHILVGAPDWSVESLKRSEIKGFSDFQNLAKSRNDAWICGNDFA
jgi:hypothetical protein